MIRLPVFMYHHISESPQGLPSTGTLWIAPDHFKQQMLFLFEHGFRCLSLSEVVANWQERKPQPKRGFALTFDDGYIDNYENALPTLREYGFSGTMFVVVRSVENGNRRYLSWQQVRELAQNNITFGSHTLTHSRLTQLDKTTVKYELNESKKIIEDRLGLPVDLLAYPYGDVNEHVQDAAREAGYLAACGVGRGYFSRFNLWRVPTSEHDSELALYWKASGGYYTYTWLRETTYLGRKMRDIKRKISERKRKL